MRGTRPAYWDAVNKDRLSNVVMICAAFAYIIVVSSWLEVFNVHAGLGWWTVTNPVFYIIILSTCWFLAFPVSQHDSMDISLYAFHVAYHSGACDSSFIL